MTEFICRECGRRGVEDASRKNYCVECAESFRRAYDRHVFISMPQIGPFRGWEHDGSKEEEALNKTRRDNTCAAAEKREGEA